MKQPVRQSNWSQGAEGRKAFKEWEVIGVPGAVLQLDAPGGNEIRVTQFEAKEFWNVLLEGCVSKDASGMVAIISWRLNCVRRFVWSTKWRR